MEKTTAEIIVLKGQILEHQTYRKIREKARKIGSDYQQVGLFFGMV